MLILKEKTFGGAIITDKYGDKCLKVASKKGIFFTYSVFWEL